jgi:acyl-homoserine lactone acylase PvdQ
MSGNALKALEVLGPWYKAGASSDLTAQGAPLAMHLTILFRMITTKLTMKYGGGGSGLCYWLKNLAARLDKNPKAQLDEDEVQFVDGALSSAWETATRYYGADTKKWCENAQKQVTKRVLGFFESLDGYPSLDRAQDFAFPRLTCVDGHTIKSQAQQSYTQYVPMHDVDSAKSILPIGQSELKDSKMRWKTYEMWGKGELHPAPLSREAVEKIKLSSKTLLSGKGDD